MAGDDTRKYASDRHRIDAEDPLEIRWWATALNVSEQRLREAIAQVGTRVNDVRRYLGR
jgi:hypothetical protein